MADVGMQAFVDVEKGLVRREAFTSDDVHRLEVENVFLRSWLYFGHESEIAEPGAYVVRRMGSAPVILVRRQDGGLAAFLNSCRHRGAKLCRTEAGQARLPVSRLELRHRRPPVDHDLRPPFPGRDGFRYRLLQPSQSRRLNDGLTTGAMSYCHFGRPSGCCWFRNEHYSKGPLPLPYFSVPDKVPAPRIDKPKKTRWNRVGPRSPPIRMGG